MSVEQHYTTAEVADLLRVHPETILRAARRGSIRSVRIGNDRRYPESAVRAFLNENADQTHDAVASVVTLPSTRQRRS